MKKFYFIILFAGFLLPFVSNAQSVVVLKGKVVNERSLPLENAVVRLLNSSYGAITDKDGMFEIKNIPPGAYLLNTSLIGYSTISRPVTAGIDSPDLIILMKQFYKQLDELIVTAQKREEQVQELPVSITVLSAKEIEDSRVWEINDLSAVSPNLFTGDAGDKRNVTSVRGIVTTSYDPAVATYIDGVNQFGLDTYISQLYDVERIEILRGPQGTLYGRNAMGGVINIITKKPENKNSVFAEATIGNYNAHRFTLGIKAPLIKDKLYVGAAGLFEGTDGFYINEFNNSPYDKQHSLSGNYYLKYLPAAKWGITINVKHTANRNSGPFPLVTGVEEALKNPFKLSQNAVTKMVDNTVNASASVNYSGRSFNFNSQSSFQSNSRIYQKPIDADFSSLDAITIINDYGRKWNNVHVFTQEFKLSSPAKSDNRLSWVAGTYFYYQHTPVKQATHFGEDAMIAGMPDNNFSLINTSTGKSSGAAVYAQATYRTGSKIDFIAGLRFDHEHKQLSVLGEYQKDPDPNPVYSFQSDTSASASFKALSPRLGLLYHFTARNNVFITYSKGFRAGGLTPLSPDPSQPPLFTFKPELSSSVEAGFKNIFFNKKMTLNVSFFLTKVTDVQVPTLILPDAVTITRNTGKLESKGVEAEMKLLPAKGLQLDYNFGYTRAVYNSLKIAHNNAEIDLAGKRQIFTPDVTSMLALQYNIAIGKADNNLFLRGEWKFLGNQFFDFANTIEQKAYSLFNGRFGINLKKSSLAVWIRNISDKKYILYGYDFGAVHLGSPQTFGATFSVKL